MSLTAHLSEGKGIGEGASEGDTAAVTNKAVDEFLLEINQQTIVVVKLDDGRCHVMSDM